MRIGVISDTHDNLPNFKKAIDFFKRENISLILHCGDISNPNTLKKALKGFSGKLKGVLGNADNIYQFSLKDYQSLQTEVFEKIGELEIEGKKIAFTHYPWEGKRLAKSGNYDIVFYGHTHKPSQKKIDNCLLVNPGNVAGIIFRATFAVFDTENNNLELKIIK